MDILSHSLWAGAAAKVINTKAKNKVKIKWAMFWGVFPDLFAFTIPLIWLFWNLFVNHIPLSELPRPEDDRQSLFGNGNLQHQSFSLFYFVSLLYSLSHSLVIFSVVFGITYYIFRRACWELIGWLLHILSDIPTHTSQFYPTPFLWPISDFKVSGILWKTPWFMIINYTALILVYGIFWIKRNKFQDTSGKNSVVHEA